MQKLLYILLATIISLSVFSQDIIILNIQEADSIFLNQNLNLLSERYNIDKAEAMLVQAGLFENPSFNIEQTGYSNSEDFFNKRLEHLVEIEQLIRISGKKSKQKEISRYNIEISRHEFELVLRRLKYLLHKNLIDAFYTQKSILILKQEIEHLQELINVYNIEYTKGNVSLIEKTRLDALFFTLKTEELEYTKELNNIQKELKLLLNLNGDIEIIPNLNNLTIDTSLSIFEKNNELINNNPAIKIAEIEKQILEAKLVFHKRSRVPDIGLKGIFNKANNTSPSYYGLGLSFHIPIFDRNQGNIISNNAEIEQSKLNYQYKVNEINFEISSNIENLKLIYNLYINIDKSFEKNFSNLIKEVTISFKKQNINILEFIDYYNTYKETSLKLYEYKKNLLIEAEKINMHMGRNYIKLCQKNIE